MDEHETMEQRQKSVEMPSIFPNPENPLEIKIPLFEGPLDLLLHLIRKKLQQICYAMTGVLMV